MTNVIVNSGSTFPPGTIAAGTSVTINVGATAVASMIDGGQETSFGTVNSATVNQDGLLTISAGAADNTTVGSGGDMVVNGGVAFATTIGNGGTAAVLDSIISSVTVDSGGIGLIDSFSVAQDVTVDSGGILVVSSGAELHKASIADGGHVVLIPGAATTGTIQGVVQSTGIAVIGPAGTFTQFDTSASDLTLGSDTTELVLSGGIALGGTVGAGANQQVFSGGSASGVVLDHGFQTVNSGASASAITVDQGGVEYVYDGGSAIDTTVNSGFAIVDSGGAATRITVNSGGNASVDGVINATTVNAGGSEYVNAGGTAVATTLNSGGNAYVFGTASNTTISSGAYEVVESGISDFNNGIPGTVVGEFVGNGGVLIADGGVPIASAGSVSSAAFGAVTSGGTIAGGGIEVLFAGATDIGTTVQSGGTYIPLQGAVVSGLTVQSGGTVVSTGVVLVQAPATVSLLDGAADGLVVGSGQSEFILSDATVSGTKISNHGYSEVDAGGAAQDTIIQGGGTLVVAAGGKATGGVTFSGSGGTLTLKVPSLPDAVVSGFGAGETIDFATITSGVGSASIVGGNTLEVSNGATTETLRLDPGQDFSGVSLVAQTTSAGTTVTIEQPPSATPVGNPQPVDIPLYILPFNGGYKIGIQVSLDGGASYQMYEFDTGGTGFFSSYSPSFWSSYTPLSATPITMTYTSGWHYTAQIVSTNVTFPTVNGGTVTVDNANVGLISSAVDGTTQPLPQTWNSDLTGIPSSPPLETSFYGDFGMGLGNNGLSAVLSQMTGGLSNGFIISLGAYPNGVLGNVGSVQVGLTAADIASFKTVISMQGQNFLEPSANSGEPTYTEVLAQGALQLISAGGGTTFTAPSGFVYDTGAPSMEIHEGTDITANDLAPFGTLNASGKLIIAQGTSIDVSAPVAAGAPADSSSWNLGFSQDGNSGSDVAGVSTANTIGDPLGYVNTGLNAFFGYRIMFDLADGIVGFEQISCFAAGTRIATPDGEADVAALQPGDEVLTHSGAAQKIVWVGWRDVDCRHHPSPRTVWPVRIRADAFGPGLPRRDLFLSPDHALFLDGVLIPVCHLVNGGSIAQVGRARVSYYHVELARHDVILAEGLPAETYLEIGQRTAFANGGDAVDLHPVFAPDLSLHWEAAGYAPLVVAGPVLARVRQRLRLSVPAAA